MLYAPGLPDMETVKAVCSAVGKPVNILAAAGMTVAELGRAGAKRISVGSKLTCAAFGALDEAAREMLDQGSFEYSRKGVPFAKLQKQFATG